MLQRLEDTRQAEALQKKEEAKDCAVQTKRKAAAAASAILQAEKGQAQSAKAGGSKDPNGRGGRHGRSTCEAPIG